MGIPMWREPSEADTFKSALEKDRSAAARSAIRRQATIRRPSRYSSHAGGNSVLSSLPSQILDEIHRGVNDSRLGVRSHVPNSGTSEDGIDLDSSRREALNRSGSRTTSHRRGGVSSRRTRLSNGLVLTDLLGVPPRPDPNSRPRSQNVPLTPHFAPAFSYYSTASSPRSDSIRLPPLRRTDSRNYGFPSHGLSVSLRELREAEEGRRPGARSDPQERQPLVDGLGDRQRSMSPDGERETDTYAWDTLLSTITPDSHLPSTNTSFTSNPGSTGASRGGTTGQSSHLTYTMPSSLGSARAGHGGLDTYPDHLHPCDFSSSDEDETPVNYHGLQGRGLRPRSRRRSPGLHSTMSSAPPVPTNYPAVPTFTFSFPDDYSDLEINDMEDILDRLDRREEIPDDWWAAAGLPRTVGRSLGANTAAPENDGPPRADS